MAKDRDPYAERRGLQAVATPVAPPAASNMGAAAPAPMAPGNPPRARGSRDRKSAETMTGRAGPLLRVSQTSHPARVSGGKLLLVGLTAFLVAFGAAAARSARSTAAAHVRARRDRAQPADRLALEAPRPLVAGRDEQRVRALREGDPEARGRGDGGRVRRLKRQARAPPHSMRPGTLSSLSLGTAVRVCVDRAEGGLGGEDRLSQ